MAARFSTTTITTEPSPTLPPKPASLTKVDGQPARDGLTTTKTGISTSWSPTTLTGPRRTIYGVENAGRAIAPTAIQTTTKARKRSFITTTKTAPSPT